MAFPDAIIYITYPVIVSYGVIRCRIPENGKVQLLLVMTWIMALFLAAPSVGMVSISLLLSLSIGNCGVTGHLRVICHNVIRLITPVLDHILWCRV